MSFSRLLRFIFANPLNGMLLISSSPGYLNLMLSPSVTSTIVTSKVSLLCVMSVSLPGFHGRCQKI